MAKPLPVYNDLVNYNHAVAGHDGTLSDVDGELFIKPCTPAEISFYKASIASHPSFAEFMPTFLGTLSLDVQLNDQSIEEITGALLAKHSHCRTTVIEPTSNGSTALNTEAITNSTNISDTIVPLSLKSPGAPLQKEPPSSLVAKHSIPEVVVPSKVVGKRILTNQAVVLENAAYGFLHPNILDIKLGVRLYADNAHQEKKTRFDKVSEETTHKDFGFRIAGMRVWQGEGAKGGDINEDGYRIYDKNYGRFSVSKDNIKDAFSNFVFAPTAGIDEELGKIITQAFLIDVERIQKVLEEQESRMFSASLLFVYEGDGKVLRAAIEEVSGSPTTLANGDESISVKEEDEDEPTRPRIYTVKVIDFAHAKWTPGLGPDENSLIGVRSLAKILKSLGK